MKRSRITVVIGFLLILIFGLLLFVYQVRKSEVAVVTMFGRVVHIKETPGPDFRLPWPIENVAILDQRIQIFEGKFEPAKLPDENIVMLLVYVGWKIDKPEMFFRQFANGSITLAEKTLEDLVRSAKMEVAGQHRFSDFISTDPKQMKFAQIENEILQKVQQQGARYGVEIKFVQIKKIGLPETVTKNVLDRMSAERDYYGAQIKSSGEEEATKIKSKADSDALKLTADADAQALTIKAEGERQMIKSLQVLQQNPTLAEFLMQNSAMERLLNGKSTLVLDQSTSPLNLLQPIQTSKIEIRNGSATNQP
jgi:membrane protease subunit HflC